MSLAGFTLAALISATPTFSVTGGAAFDVGTLPFVEPRFAISGAFTHGLFRAVVDARLGLPGRVATTRVQRTFEAQLAGCMNFDVDRFAFAPCAATSLGTWATANTTRALVTIGPQVRFTANLFANIELGVLAGLRINLVRPLETTSLVSGDFQLTLGWRW